MTHMPRITRALLFVILALAGSAYAVSGDAPKFDSARAWDHLRQLVAIGPRPAGSPGIEQARKYIKDRLSGLGVDTREQAWDAETPSDPDQFEQVSDS